ncbi:MAG: LysR family transcriptional regulator [Candidatus Synoicihabitans palmerolidicus]|nr:LysR family transcriptional regulator [Candidatus Synoicihabitans palmerolidicus]
MELRHLRYYVAVAEELNYRRAAERMRMEQPALSKQIKDLEFDVGARLLNRNTAGVELTDAGRLFLDEARDILERVEDAVGAVREVASGKRGHLTLANVDAISAGFMPVALSAYHLRYPEVEVDVQELILPEQMAAVERGRIHLGFVLIPGKEIPEHLSQLRVFESEFRVAIGKRHRLARRKRISLHELTDERLLCIETGGHDMHRRLVREGFAASGVTPGRFKKLDSLESLQAMIEGDQGVSFLAPMPQGRRRSEGIVYRPLKETGDDLKCEMHAVWRKEALSQLALNFVEVLREVCGIKDKAV